MMLVYSQSLLGLQLISMPTWSSSPRINASLFALTKSASQPESMARVMSHQSVCTAKMLCSRHSAQLLKVASASVEE